MTYGKYVWALIIILVVLYATNLFSVRDKINGLFSKEETPSA